MKIRDFFGKFVSGYLWGHLLAMTFVVVALCFGVKYGLDVYTHHGQNIRVPKLEGMYYAKASLLLENEGLVIQVSDSGYNKRLPAECILAQSPGSGMRVKEGHTVYLTINSPSSPTFAIPDIVDNASVREAEAKLLAMGFQLTQPQEVVGEKDWVYGILCRGRRVSNGDRVPIDHPLTLMVGSGTYDETDDIDYVDGSDYGVNGVDSGGVDDFEEVTEPPTAQ
jgi:beta-lactam-binding protein with PASTA domain